MDQNIQKGEVILYQPNETVRLEVRLENETVWLTQQQIADLFGVDRTSILRHIRNIYKSEELDENSTCAKNAQVRIEGGREVLRDVILYNLDMILSVGYRVNSKRAISFRKWASNIIKDYLFKGYSFNQVWLNIQKQVDSRFEIQTQRILKLEESQKSQQEQIDLYIKTNTLPQEQLFQNGCVFDAWSYVSALIREAKQEIILIYNYIDETVLAILAKRADGVKATIHTRYTEKFKTDLEKFNKQYPDKAVTFVQLSQHNHDRFLIIDDNVYLLGASLKDLGNTWGAMIKMNETGKEDVLRYL